MLPTALYRNLKNPLIPFPFSKKNYLVPFQKDAHEVFCGNGKKHM